MSTLAAARSRQSPDEINARHPVDAPRYRCSHCGAASVLQWHKVHPTLAVCSRRECNEALT